MGLFGFGSRGEGAGFFPRQGDGLRDRGRAGSFLPPMPDENDSWNHPEGEDDRREREGTGVRNDNPETVNVVERSSESGVEVEPRIAETLPGRLLGAGENLIKKVGDGRFGKERPSVTVQFLKAMTLAILLSSLEPSSVAARNRYDRRPVGEGRRRTEQVYRQQYREKPRDLRKAGTHKSRIVEDLLGNLFGGLSLSISIGPRDRAVPEDDPDQEARDSWEESGRQVRYVDESTDPAVSGRESGRRPSATLKELEAYLSEDR